MRKFTIVSVQLALALGIFLYVEHKVVSVECTEVKQTCNTYERGTERCVTGLYSTSFTSTPNTANEIVSSYVHGRGGDMTSYCGREYRRVLGIWTSTGNGCGGEFPNSNCL